MVWSYHSVKELKQKHRNGEEITDEEKEKLDAYIQRKKQAPCKKTWHQEQLRIAEKLQFKLQQKKVFAQQ